MKKKLPFLLIAIGAIAAITAAVIVSCSVAPSGDSDGTSNTHAPVDTAQSDITTPEHLAGSESQYSEKIENIETEDRTDAPESQTELPTESEDTAEPITHSLEFLSNGNGTCSLVGIGTYKESYVSIPTKSPDGDVVIAISEKAFLGNSTIKAVEIPSTVMTIGDMAFSDCKSLLYITVDKSNNMFTDVGGVLYNKDLTSLLCYPSGSGVSTLSISSEITSISPMAFYNCNNLKTVIYSGSVKDWSEISIGEMNYGLFTASVSFAEENLQ